MTKTYSPIENATPGWPPKGAQLPEFVVSETPAGGGVNITGSDASGNSVGNLSPEGVAVVEQPKQDEKPASAGSDESNELLFDLDMLRPAMTAPEILKRAADHMANRAATYDRPEGERSMGAAVVAFNAIAQKDLTEAEGWLLLQLLKDVRLWQRPGYHADSAEDCVAYAALKAEAKQKEAR